MSEWDVDSELLEAIPVDLVGIRKVKTVTVQECQYLNKVVWRERMISLIEVSQLYGLKSNNGDEY